MYTKDEAQSAHILCQSHATIKEQRNRKVRKAYEEIERY